MAEENQAVEPRFDVHKVYLKDISLETPNSPQIFNQEWKPEFNIQLANQTVSLNDEGLFDVGLRLTVTAKLGDKTAFLVEIEQAGLFSISGLEEGQIARLQGTLCPNILFPYAREALDNILQKAGFPPMALAHVNFDMLYEQRLAQMQTEGNA